MSFSKLILITCLFLPSAVTRADEPITSLDSSGVPAGKSYIYKESAGKPRRMEIYFPPGHDAKNARVPGMILFHGGGWSGGSLKQFQAACHYFASRGLVCATAEYQMLGKADRASLASGETKKRVCITDAKSAIRWFKQHANELGVDPNRIITGGGSAGGHISALATMNPGLNDPNDPSGVDTSVVASMWFNPAFSPDDNANPEVDVLRFIRGKMPPAIAFFGTKDTWLKGWDVVHQKIENAGNKNIEVYFAPDQAHSFFNNEPWRTQTLIEADRFLVRHQLLSGEPTLVAPADATKLTLSRE